VERTAELAEPGVFGRGAGSDVCVHVAADDGDPAEVVSRRALVFGVSPMTGVVEIENAGRVALAVSGAGGPSIFAPATTVSVREAAVFTWPNDDRDGFRLSVETPSRGLLVLRSDAGEQQVVLRAPRTPVRADPALFGAIDVFFHVDFVDGTGFLVLNNEGSVPLRFGSFEGKQLQWPVDAPREIEAGPLRIEIHLTGAE
jgi:hypothetical protein